MQNNKTLEQNTKEKDTNATEKMHCGLVPIIGRPSSGKSTFLNAVCGGKVSIVSSIPQTTRNAIRGIVTKENGQILFLDTPGLHKSEKKFNEKLKNVSVSTLKDADLVLYLIDSTRSFGEEEEEIFNILKTESLSEKLFIAITKVDDKMSKTGLFMLEIQKAFPALDIKKRVFEISSKKNTNLDTLVESIILSLPISPLMYPPDYYTDQDMKFRIAEIIREKAIDHTDQEVPHALYVSIDDLTEKRGGKDLYVKAFLCVERESQKGILVGKDGNRIKLIKQESIKTLRNIFDYHIILSLQVKLDKDWRKNEKTIQLITS